MKVQGVSPAPPIGGKAASTQQAQSKSQAPQVQQDQLSLSPQAQAKLDKIQKKQQEPAFDRQWMLDQMESARQQAEATEEQFDTMGKCLLIATRILSGDKVTIQDQKFLMEHNSEMYFRAQSLRQTKKDPKEYDSITEEEEKVEEATATPESGPPQVASAPAESVPAAAPAEKIPEA